MRWLWIALAFITVGTVAVKAQIFNLENEDEVEVRKPAATTTRRRVPSTPILVPAAEVPEDKDDTAKLNKLYGDIVKELKANNVDEAVKLMSDHDVITKQKVIHRLMQENPDDFRIPAGAVPGSAADESPSQDN